MNTTLRRTAPAVLGIACTSVATVLPASAATNEPTTLHVEGTHTQISEDMYESHGGLLGDFWILTFDPLYESDSLVIGTGTERFVGCVDVDLDASCGADEPSGELRFDFVEWMTLDPSTGALIESNCTHPITGGSDGFLGARGIVTMHAVPVDGDVEITYEGTVVLNAVPDEPLAPEVPAAHAFAVDAAPTSGGHC
jgi:hypothetical protein